MKRPVSNVDDVAIFYLLFVMIYLGVNMADKFGLSKNIGWVNDEVGLRGCGVRVAMTNRV